MIIEKKLSNITKLIILNLSLRSMYDQYIYVS